jgi:hypothetical protein
MTAQQLRCHGCGRRFGRRARPLFVFPACLLCQPCGDLLTVHRRLFFACLRRHPAREHHGTVISVGRARHFFTYQPQEGK